MLMRIVPASAFHFGASHGSREAPATWSHPAPIPLDAERRPDGLVLRLDLPGIPLDAIDIQTAGSTMTVRAERRPSDHEPAGQALISERRLGVFTRQITLDPTADLARASASLDAGVLTIRVPAATGPATRTIPITQS